LGGYCQPLDDLNVGRLIEQFIQLEGRFESLKARLSQKTEEYRRMLDQQYKLILDDL
jgi:hypothetical protein